MTLSQPALIVTGVQQRVRRDLSADPEDCHAHHARKTLQVSSRHFAEEVVTDTLTTRLSGTFAVLSMAAEFAAIGLAFRHGINAPTLNAMNWGVEQQLLFFQPDWMATLFTLGILAPCCAMLSFLTMYSVLAPGGSAAFCGVIVTSLGFLIGVIGELIRLSAVTTLPARYVAAPEAAKPAVLALGAFLSRLFLTILPISLLLVSAVGMPLVAVAILRGGTLPRWLGWLLLAPSVLIGYVGIPLMMLVSPSVGGPVVGLGLNVVFLWTVLIGIVLLRWQSSRSATHRG